LRIKIDRGLPSVTSSPNPNMHKPHRTRTNAPRILSNVPPNHQTAKMGIPYSKEIGLALDQVAPLVEAGFVVLQTTKNISILLMILQILTVLLLWLILLTAFGLILSVNPDLVAERKALVTPVMKWVAGWLMSKQD
jgi:hypothetical protein